MAPFHSSRHYYSSVAFTTVLWIFSGYSTAIAQNTQPDAGGVSSQQNKPASQHQNAGKNPSEPPTQRAVSNEDASMMRNMAKANIAEIQLAALAQAISENRIVHAYAQQMLDEHSVALDELKKIAAEKGVVMPGGPDEDHVVAARQLAVMRGDDFDRKYLTHAGTEAHGKSLLLYQDVSKRADDKALKAYAEKNAPTIGRHLKLAQEAQGTYVTSAKSAK